MTEKLTFEEKLPLFSLKKNPTNIEVAKMTSSTSVNEYVRNFFSDDLEVYESFFCLMLNRSNNTVGYAKISQGGISGTVVDIRLVCKYALDSLCSSVIVVHNHPSGNLNPSTADKQITKKLENALMSLDIKLLDHIIVVPEVSEYFSFADEGLL